MAIESIKVEEIQPDGTKKELEVDKSVTGYHNFLVMFNAIIDLDFAVLKMIQAEYNNPKYINQKVMALSIQQIRMLLVNRKQMNPLYLCINDKKIADNIYEEIMTTRYNDLLTNKMYLSATGVFFLISVFAAMERIDVTVVCGSKQEEEVVHRYHKHVKTIVPEKLSDIDVNEYTDFIFKNKNDIFKFGQVYKEKRLTLLSYRYNVEIQGGVAYPDIETAGLLWYSGYSKIALMDIYSKEQPDYAELVVPVKKKPENK